MKKMMKLLSLVLAVVMLLGCLTACGDKATDDKNSDSADDKVITVGATPTPHAEILNAAKDALEAEGYTLKVLEFTDYVQPNTALVDGDLDANYFQHTPYLNSFNAANGTDLVSAAKIHYEPFGLYGNGVDSVDAIASDATILIPADDSNETRALLLLAQEGLIELPADASAEKGVTTLDIVDAKGHDVQALQADTVPAQLANSNEGTVAVINGNYALDSGLTADDAIYKESEYADNSYYCLIAVRSEDAENPVYKRIVEAYQTQDTIDIYNNEFKGFFVPAWTLG